MAETLRAINVSYRVDGRLLLDGVNIEVHSGERLAITGPSGVGKTSLLNILAGLIRPDHGEVRLGDRSLSARLGPHKEVAIVFQGYGLLSLLTAGENVEIGLYARGVEPKRASESARSALSRVGLLPWRNHLTQELSGGQQQRIAIARALAVPSAVLLADEPTAEQDPEHRMLLLDALLEKATRGTIVVLATHDPDIAIQCDRVLALGAR